MKLVIRIILNIFLFATYSLVGMNAVNFIYDLILNLSWNPVPISNDPIHLKIAWITFLIVVLSTLVFRKYFYLKIRKKEILEENNELDINNSISFEKISTKIDKELKKKTKEEVNVLNPWDMEIFIGKEIK